MTFIKKNIFLLASLGFLTASAQAQPSGKKISENLFGIFFEDLNYAADGGLYAELVQNRSFEYNPSDVNWNKNPHNNWYFFTSWDLERKNGGICTVSLETDTPIHINNPHYLVFDALTIGADGVGIRNDGFDGIVLQKGSTYNFSAFMRMLDGTDVPIVIRLIDNNNKQAVLAEAKLTLDSKDWKKYEATLVPTVQTDNASLVILFKKKSKTAIDMVSLFPADTFKGRKNGLRRDIAEKIAELKPSFMRFPGGCLAHGDGISNIYNWKNTIGPVEQRKGERNIWNYYQSYGLGYFEYLQFCEDIGAKPIPVVAAGVSCQNSGRTRGTGQEAIPMEDMSSYIQDVLDLIEYCNGTATSTWGKKRAEAGHPAPFNLEYLGIGNEDKITKDFEVRFKMIVDAVRKKYPKIKIIGTSGPASDGEDFEKGWKTAISENVSTVDEHYYKSPDWFLKNLNRYDRYSRTAPKVYLGEYASWGNKLFNALAEAAYMTGLERNGDVVEFASYAPLLARIGHTQWNPDLIYFDGKDVYPTVNYYVQQLFSVNRGNIYFDNIINVKDSNETQPVSCLKDKATGDLILKFVNTTDREKEVHVNLSQFKKLGKQASLYVLKGDKDATNTRENGCSIVPVESAFKPQKAFDYIMPPYSLSVITIKGIK